MSEGGGGGERPGSCFRAGGGPSGQWPVASHAGPGDRVALAPSHKRRGAVLKSCHPSLLPTNTSQRTGRRQTASPGVGGSVPSGGPARRAPGSGLPSPSQLSHPPPTTHSPAPSGPLCVSPLPQDPPPRPLLPLTPATGLEPGGAGLGRTVQPSLCVQEAGRRATCRQQRRKYLLKSKQEHHAQHRKPT